MNRNLRNTALVTGASSGIGAAYADRLARRGHDLILVARKRERLEALAEKIRRHTKRSVLVAARDLTNREELLDVERILRIETSITMFVNNASIHATTPLMESGINELERMVALNVHALVRLTHALLPGLINRGCGTLINVGSVAGISPETSNGAFAGTKAFGLAFTRSLQRELAAHNIRVQVVLSGSIAGGFGSVTGSNARKSAARTAIDAETLVDTALCGLDRGDLVTIPALRDIADWGALESIGQQTEQKLPRRLVVPRRRVAS